MNNICLLSVNWNQKDCVSLLLKSYIKHHYKGVPLKLKLVDNGSDDGSKEFLEANEIPFLSLPDNVGHENAINIVYEGINTKYVVLCDTDLEFHDNIFDYLYNMNDNCISAGELIDKNYIGETKIVDRISPWCWIWDISKMKEAGVNTFRTKEDWTYDVGSEYWERMQQAGFTNYNIERKPGHQDNDLISMQYPKYDHFGKTSWDIQNKHGDRYSEVMRRRMYVKERLELYKEIDLRGKFV